MTLIRHRRALTAASALIVLTAIAIPARTADAQVAQAGSPVVELLTKAKNALMDLKYTTADSIARQVLALGPLINQDQQLAAIQLRAAAFYPEEADGRKTDSAVAAIRQMIALGGKSIPKDVSWEGLDALVSLVQQASTPAKILISSKTLGAVVYVNGAPQGTLSGLRTILVPPGVEVKLSIRAEKCTPWDTAAVFRASDSVRVGRRDLTCPP